MPNTLTLELKAAPAPYDRNIFGGFLEHFHRIVYGGIFDPASKFADAYGFRQDVIAALKDLQTPVVRWPGGCFVSAYHWRKGVGAPRTPAYDKAWRVEDPNTFGTDEYIAWCRQVGCEPYICTNAGTGTAEEMSDWVEYCNLPAQGEYARLRIANGHPEPYGVKYWSIGNENYGGWEMGAKTVDEWGYLVREAAKLMVNVDPTVQLLAAALADKQWTIPLLKRAGHYLRHISIHGYWDPIHQVDTPAPFEKCIIRTPEPEQQILQTINILKRLRLDNKISIAFDEWNLRGWHHPGMGAWPKETNVAARDRNDLNATYTMADALFSACFLNACLRNSRHVKMACIAPLVNGRGPIYVHPAGIVKRTTYHVMHLYTTKLLPFVLPSRLKSEFLWHGARKAPALDAIVTCNHEKTQFVIAAVNKDPTRPITMELDVALEASTATTNHDEKAAQHQMLVLSGDGKDAHNDVDQPNRVVPQTQTLQMSGNRIILPPHSLSILTLNRSP